MDNERELLKGNTPTLVLAVLEDAPQHGYAIAREINKRSGDALRCKQGTLYPALHALERDGLIQGAWETGGGERPRSRTSRHLQGLSLWHTAQTRRERPTTDAR